MSEATKRRRVPGWVKVLVVLGVAGVGLPCLMTRVLFAPWTQEGPSMEPSLPNGARFFASVWSAPSRGDVVVVENPTDGMVIGKRVVAVGGDTVEMLDGQLVVNGTPVTRRELGPAEPGDRGLVCYQETMGEHAWLVLDDPTLAATMEPVEVPPDHVYVLGDNRVRSADSRLLGPLPADGVRGVLAWIYHPGDAAQVPRCPR